MHEMLLLYIVCASTEQAQAISHALLEARLIACVNLHAIDSLYWWQGNIEADNEVVLLAKTVNRPGLYAQIEAKVRELHSYEIPCIMQLPVAHVNADYLAWLAAQVKAEN